MSAAGERRSAHSATRRRRSAATRRASAPPTWAPRHTRRRKRGCCCCFWRLGAVSYSGGAEAVVGHALPRHCGAVHESFWKRMHPADVLGRSRSSSAATHERAPSASAACALPNTTVMLPSLWNPPLGPRNTRKRVLLLCRCAGTTVNLAPSGSCCTAWSTPGRGVVATWRSRGRRRQTRCACARSKSPARGAAGSSVPLPCKRQQGIVRRSQAACARFEPPHFTDLRACSPGGASTYGSPRSGHTRRPRGAVAWTRRGDSGR